MASEEERKKAELVRQFGSDWVLRVETREIARKNKQWYELLWPRQYEVKTMYLWIKINWLPHANQNIPFPIDHDNLPKNSGKPVTYALLGGWTIPKRDLNLLTKGPLYNENWELLVPERTNAWKTALNRILGIAGVIIAISGVAWGVYWLFNP
ncbi:MAG: hypothetical protein OEZ51_10050 [Nitrospinota bacterium]|nr:hypothetical protein [Nitrospinota bacterium]